MTEILYLAKNDIDRNTSLGENDIDRDISLAKNYIDRDGQQQEKSKMKYFFINKTSLYFCRDTLSLAKNVNDRDLLFS